MPILCPVSNLKHSNRMFHNKCKGCCVSLLYEFLKRMVSFLCVLFSVSLDHLKMESVSLLCICSHGFANLPMCKTFVAAFAFVLTIRSIFDMVPEYVFCGKCLYTFSTFIKLLSCMSPHMRLTVHV